ncbi:MAG TPA: carbohydrate-binding domain-containing protein, partial [Rhodopila sp.]|nr:carbohydrate-binding domain-containing protein [Rhodopila sp.]
FYVTSGGNSGSTTSATISASTGASNPSISFAAPSTGTSDTTGGNSSNGNIPAATSGGGAAGAPADTLTLHLAEDAWNGDAQFSVSIDGQTIGSQTVTASHSAGNWEDLTFSGNFGSGPHDVGVTFTNDAYGGSPATDRNLYVNGVDFNGAHYGTGVTGLYTNGTAHFVV